MSRGRASREETKGAHYAEDLRTNGLNVTRLRLAIMFGQDAPDRRGG